MLWLTRRALARPGAALAVLAAITLGLGAGLARLRTDVGYRAFLGADHPEVAAFDEFLQRFGGGLPVVIAWRCEPPAPCTDVFDPASLRMADDVARALAATPGVARTESPAGSELLLPSADGFAVRTLVERGVPVADRAALAERAVIDPLWVGNLISADRSVGAILLELASSDGTASRAVFAAIERALAPWRARGFRYHLVGGPVDFVIAAAELRTANERLIPLVATAIAGVVWLLFRSAGAVALTLASMGVAVIWTAGTLGWLGWAQNTLTQTLPPLVLVVGSCNGIHLLARYASEAGLGGADTRALRGAALERAAADVSLPCTVATLTTAAGLLSFVTSDLESFVRYGAIAALGVVYTLLTSFALLPVLLACLPARSLPARDLTTRWDAGLERLVRLADKHAIAILVVSGVLAVGCAWGATRLTVDVRFEDLYGEQSRVVQWVRFVERHLRKAETIEVELRLPEGERFVEPRAVAELERLAAFLPASPGLGRVHSLVEPLSWAHRLVQDDDPAYQRPGDTRRQNAQLLALLSLDDPHRLAPWLTLDQNRARVSVESAKVPENVLGATIARIERYLATELPAGWDARLTGAGRLIHALVSEVRATQLSSFAMASLVVLALVAVFLRSPGWALLAMVPTALPVVVTLGAMGLWGVPLDIGTAMVAAVVIGIAIDDTVHLLTQYRRRRARGLGVRDSIREAVPHVGRALVTTSVALALGFLSLLASPWSSIAGFGLVAAVAIMGALAADLLVLPALLLVGGRLRLPDLRPSVPRALLLASLLAVPAGVAAQEPAVSATAPADAADVVPPDPREILRLALANRYELDARATVEITIISRTGGTEHRRAEIASKYIDGQNVSYGKFTYPEDMRGMAVLRFEHVDRNDDFWAFLPEFRRVRRLSAAQKNDLFLGTDAAFEDIERRKIDDYQIALLPSAEIDGEDTWTVEARPVYESGYERVEYAVAKSDHSIVRTRHYKRGAQQPFKIIDTPRATTEEHGGHTVPMYAVVRDLERGTSTELKIKRIMVNPELDDRLFNTRSLSQERSLPRYESLVVRED